MHEIRQTQFLHFITVGLEWSLCSVHFDLFVPDGTYWDYMLPQDKLAVRCMPLFFYFRRPAKGPAGLLILNTHIWDVIHGKNAMITPSNYFQEVFFPSGWHAQESSLHRTHSLAGFLLPPVQGSTSSSLFLPKLLVFNEYEWIKPFQRKNMYFKTELCLY